jgi:uncharacterized protein (TIGR03437 family)
MVPFERRCFVRVLLTAALAATAVIGQTFNFDSSGNATLKGQYFVRELVLRNLSAQGEIGDATGAIGIATFDGAGKYSFNGQLSSSAGIAGSASASVQGTYAVAANGLLRISSVALTGAFPLSVVTFAFGGVGGVGPSAFTASATENASQLFDLMVAIPVGSAASNASLKGSYNAVYFSLPRGAVGQARQAHIPLQADGAGGFGAVIATGSATDSASLTTQSIPDATYSLSGSSGTISFGSLSADKLIGGTQAFSISADGNLLVGGSADGFDLLLAASAVASPSSSAFQGFYYLGGLETDNSVWSSQSLSLADAFYGSWNAGGQGNYTSHLRLNSNGYTVEDLTSGWSYSPLADGSFTPGDGNRYWLGAGGRVVLAMGQGNAYSIMAGLRATDYAPLYPKTDVFLHPLGIVNAASFAPATNSVAPQEMISLFGSNLSSGTAQAPAGLQVPTSLLGTSVLVNGVAAPVLAVSPTQVTVLVPGAASPDFTAYAAFVVQNGGAVCPSPAPTGSQCPSSKAVTMYTNYTAPGTFSLAQTGFGPAAAQNGSAVIGASSPARPADIVSLYLTGLGSVTPTLLDGQPSSPTGQPLNVSDIYSGSGLSVYVDGYASPNIPFGGVAPGYPAGLYQINAQIPDAASAGDDYLDILTPDAEAEQVTLRIARSPSAGQALNGSTRLRPSGRGQRAARRLPAMPRRTGAVSR